MPAIVQYTLLTVDGQVEETYLPNIGRHLAKHLAAGETLPDSTKQSAVLAKGDETFILVADDLTQHVVLFREYDDRTLAAESPLHVLGPAPYAECLAYVLRKIAETSPVVLDPATRKDLAGGRTVSKYDCEFTILKPQAI